MRAFASLDSAGGVYSFGRGYGGCLGHGAAAEEDKYINEDRCARTRQDQDRGRGETHNLRGMDVDGRVYEFGFEDTHAIDWSDDEMDDEEEEAIPTHERGEPKLIEGATRGNRGTPAGSTARSIPTCARPTSLPAGARHPSARRRV